MWGGRREEGSGWGAHVYLWWIRFDVWQNSYSISGLKIKFKRKKRQNEQEIFDKKSGTLRAVSRGQGSTEWKGTFRAESNKD